MGGNRRSYGRTVALLVSFYVAVLLFGPQQAEKGEGFFKDLYCTVGFFSGASCDLDYSQISMVMEENASPAPSVMSEQITVVEEQAPVTNVYNTHRVTVISKPEPVYEFAGNTDFYTPPPAPDSTVEEWTPLALFHKQVDKIYDRLGDRIDDLEDDLGDAFTTLSLTLTGALYDNNDSAGLNGNVLVSTGSGVVWTATSSLGIIGGSGSSQWTTSGSDIYYSGGSVGIGTSTPQYRLTVTEDGVVPEVSAVINGSGSTISVQGDGSAYFMARDVTNDIEGIFGTSINGSIFFGSMTDHALQLRTGNTTRLIIASTTGDVGVAISPTAKLHVLNTSSRPSFQVEDAASPDSTPFVIDASGDIGIGTAVPTHALTLSSGKVEAFYNTVDQVTNYERVTMGYLSNIFTIRSQEAGTGTSRALRLTSNVGSFTVGTASTNGVFQFGHTSATTNGIGILSNGTETHSSGIYTVQSLANTINQSGTAGYTMLLINPTETTIGSGLRKLIDARVGGTTRFVVQSDGNVGIGTSTPNTKLAVDGTIATGGSVNGALQLLNAAGAVRGTFQYNGSTIDLSTINSGFPLTFSPGGSEKVRFATSGNVGIGTTTPSQELTVSGDIHLTGAIYDSTNSAGTSGYVLQSTATGQRWVATSTLGFGTGNLSASDIDTSSELLAIVTNETGTGNLVFSASPTFTGTVQAAAATLSSTLTLSGTSANIALGSNFLSGDGGDEGIFVDANGNVGIGTTSAPQGVLDVYATTNGVPGGGEGIYLSSEEGGPAQIWRRGEGTIAIAPNVYVPTNFLNILNLGSDLVVEFQADGNAIFQGYQTPLIFRTSDADPITFEVFGDEKMRIDSTGFVGIGTTSPIASLHVTGNAIIGREGGDAGGADSLSVGSSAWAYGSQSFAAGNNAIANADYTMALGYLAGAYGFGSAALGFNTQANGDFSIALGSAMTGSGYGGNGEGLHAMAIGLGDMTGVRPMVTGTSSLGIFLGDQSGLELSAEQVMAIMGGNVGIGTTTPSAKLSIHATNGETNSKLFVIASSTAGATTDLFSVLNNGETYINSSFLSLNNASGAAYLDVTGSGDANSYSNLTFGSAAGPYWFMSHRTGGAFGLYYTSDDITYHNPLMVEPATPTGTLYLDSTGNVGIGTSSPASKLTISGGDVLIDNGEYYQAKRNTSGTTINVLGFESGTDNLYLRTGGASVSNRFSIVNTGGTQMFTVLNSGLVGIGTTTPGAKLDVNGVFRVIGNGNPTSGAGIEMTYSANVGYIFPYDRTAAAGRDLILGGSGAGLMVQSDGDVGIGTTTPQAKLHIQSSANQHKLYIAGYGNTLGNGAVFRPANDSASPLVFHNSSGSTVGSVATDAVSTTYNTTSDKRVKTGIEDTSLGLATLMELPVRDFIYKQDPAERLTTGFIAQELYEIFPYAVTTNGDNGVTPLQADKSPWSVDYGRVTPLIVKSVQDLNLDLQALLAGSQSPTSTFAFLLEEEDTVWSRLVVLAENFVDGVLTLAGITTDELCLKDEQGSTCIDREELEALIAGANNGSSSSDTEDEEEEVVPELSEDVEDETSSSTPEVPADDIQIEDSGEEEAQEDIEDESEDPQELVEIEEADDDTLETNE